MGAYEAVFDPDEDVKNRIDAVMDRDDRVVDRNDGVMDRDEDVITRQPAAATTRTGLGWGF